MGRKFRWAGTLLAVIFAAAACDDDSPTEVEGDPLTEEEAVELTAVIMGASYAGFMAPPGGSQSSAIGPQAEFSVVVNDKYECPLDGTRTVAGTAAVTTSEEGDTTTIAIDGTETHEDCTLPFQQDGTIVLNGNPNLSVEADLAFVDDVPFGEQTVSYGGGFSWEAGERSGSCGVDLQSSVEVEVEDEEITSISQSVTGSFCGHSIEREFTLTLD